MANELLPCPFCGQKVAIAKTYTSHGAHIGYQIFHICDDTDYGMIYKAVKGITDSDHEELIAAWNTRVNIFYSCKGCLHADGDDICNTCTRAWGDKYEVAQ